MLAFGAAVRELRTERHISAKELAHAAGISQAKLDAIEAGYSDPRYDVLLALAHGLGLRAQRHLQARRSKTKESRLILNQRVFKRRT